MNVISCDCIPDFFNLTLLIYFEYFYYRNQVLRLTQPDNKIHLYKNLKLSNKCLILNSF